MGAITLHMQCRLYRKMSRIIYMNIYKNLSRGSDGDRE